METADEIETIDDLELQLRFWFSKKYSIPMYSPELDAYDVRMMLMEHYMHTYTPPTADETVRASSSELADMMAKEFSDEENRAMDQMFGEDFSLSDDTL